MLAKRPMEKEDSMKDSSQEEDDLRSEYDFSELKGHVRGKYVERYRNVLTWSCSIPTLQRNSPMLKQ